jgi:hypothetical protein
VKLGLVCAETTTIICRFVDSTKIYSVSKGE